MAETDLRVVEPAMAVSGAPKLWGVSVAELGLGFRV